MSFNSELKELLISTEMTKDCCANAYSAGRDGAEYSPKCKSCDSHYLRGVFVRCGYMSDPDTRCELVIRADGDCEKIRYIAERHGLELRESTRKGKQILYCKKREGTEDFLAFIGAGKFTLKLKQKAVMHDIRRDANRINNAETANIDRSARACAEQLTAINTLIKQGRLSALPPELKEASEIRLEHPEDSLEELRKYFSSPISKSGIKHRFQRISAIAEENRIGGKK